MSLEEFTYRSVEVMAGKWLILSSTALFLAGVGFLHSDSSSLHGAVDEHSKMLAGISTQVKDLTDAVRDHYSNTDAAIRALTDSDRLRGEALAAAETEIKQLQRAPPVIQRETMIEPERFTPAPPSPLPNLGNALSHIFSGPPPHRWRHHP